ncbi:hypothetical protein Alg130_04452, partial [Pyrenophora tritici-repentis]
MPGIVNNNTSGNLPSSASRTYGYQLNGSADAFDPTGNLQNPQQGSMVAASAPQNGNTARPLQNGGTTQPSLPVPAGADAAIWSRLCTGSFMADITAEREAPQADPSQSRQWQQTILPYLKELFFRVPSTTDVFYMGQLLQSPDIPGLHENIVKLELTGFHWFSGVTGSRRSNLFLDLASMLPSLREVTFTMHIGSITASMWGDRQMIELEATDPVCARERRVLSLRHVCTKYGLERIFRCTNLQHIRIVYIRCHGNHRGPLDTPASDPCAPALNP